MPDILIRGMEMPPSCADCTIKGDSDCKLTRQKVKYYHEDRRDDCPLVELPPHGDLIDRDAFIAEMKKNDTYQNWLFRKMLEKQPVIVPSEKGETQ